MLFFPINSVFVLNYNLYACIRIGTSKHIILAAVRHAAEEFPQIKVSKANREADELLVAHFNEEKSNRRYCVAISGDSD